MPPDAAHTANTETFITMTDQIDISFQILDTTIRVVYGDMLALDTQVLVSSDDVYLSMKGGVAHAILGRAGPELREEVYKHTLPVELGHVIVTSGGRLPAAYVFHAVTLDFFSRPNTTALLAALIERVIALGRALEVASIALPLLGAGTAQIPRGEVLSVMVRAAVCALCANGSGSLRQLIFTVYTPPSAAPGPDPQLLEDLQPTLVQLATLAATVAPLNQRIVQLAPLAATMRDDQEFHTMLLARLQAGREQIQAHCDCAALPTGQQRDGSAPAELPSHEEYEYLEQKAQMVLERLGEDIAQFERLAKANERRVNLLEVQRASMGITVPPHVPIEIEDIRHEMERIARDRDKAEQELAAARANFAQLSRVWQTHRAA